MSYLLDTNVVSELARPAPDPAVLRRVAGTDGSALASVTWHELVYGVERTPSGRRRDGLRAFLAEIATRFPVLPYDRAAATWHAEQRAVLEARGRGPAWADAQIAATAAVHERILVTRTVQDFAGFTDLRIENWFDETGC